MTVAELITRLTAYMTQEGNHAVQFVDGAVHILHPDGAKSISDPDAAVPPPATPDASVPDPESAS